MSKIKNSLPEDYSVFDEWGEIRGDLPTVPDLPSVKLQSTPKSDNPFYEPRYIDPAEKMGELIDE